MDSQSQMNDSATDGTASHVGELRPELEAMIANRTFRGQDPIAHFEPDLRTLPEADQAYILKRLDE